MSSGGKFQSGDRIFAKIKGYPAWPARVDELVGITGKSENYKIYFYGSYESGFVKSDQMFLYTPENKIKYGKPQRKNRFKEAMEEIEQDLKIDDNGLVTEDATDSLDDDDDEGELLIDEGPSQPPVLKKEVNVKAPSKAEDTPSKPKRLTKSAKRDSLTINTPSVAPVTPVPETPQQPEMVSRSGRKIKPKRFADDEIAAPVTPASKTSATNQASVAHDDSGELDGPPLAKRPKRAAKPTPKVQTRVVTPVLKAEVEKPKVTAAKSKTTPQKPAPVEVPAVVPKIIAKTTGKPVRTSTKAVVPAPPPTPVPIPQRSVRGRPTVVKPAKEDVKEDLENDVQLTPTESMEVDKENSKESWVNEAEDGSISNDSTVKSEILAEEAGSPPPQSKGGKVLVAAKNGPDIELTFGHGCPKLESQEERRAWGDTTIPNFLKPKQDIEQCHLEAHEIVAQQCAKSVVNKDDIMEISRRKKNDLKIKQLRLEGEILDIIAEIIGCLNIQSADCDRVIELLCRLDSHKLSALILKKHPEVVNTVRKLGNYIGNVHQWEMNEEAQNEFKVKALAIRQKSRLIYENFKSLFCSSCKPFQIHFYQEVQKFQKQVLEAGYTTKETLTLTDELKGG